VGRSDESGAGETLSTKTKGTDPRMLRSVFVLALLSRSHVLPLVALVSGISWDSHVGVRDREPRWERWVVVDLATGRPLESEGARLAFCSYPEASFWLFERYGPAARYAVRDSRKL
jgi:hypothetical protein